MALVIEMVWPIIVGVTLGLAFRKALPRARDRIAKVLGNIAAALLLWLFVGALARSRIVPADLIYLACGALLPLLILATVRFTSRIMPGLRYQGQGGIAGFQFVVATFGGGTRGTILVVILFGSLPIFDEILPAFIIFDLGNFLVLLLCVPLLMRRSLGVSPRSRNPLEIPFLLVIPLAVLVILLIYLADYRYRIAGNLPGFTELTNFAASKIEYAKGIFPVFAFAAMTAGATFAGTKLKHLIVVGGQFYLFRLAGAVVAVTVFGLSLATVGAVAYVEIVIVCTVVLALCPPSSILPILFDKTAATAPARAEIRSLSLGLNLPFFIFVAGAIVFSIVLQRYSAVG